MPGTICCSRLAPYSNLPPSAYFIRQVRKQIELFEATNDTILQNAQGRTKPVVLGQVGLRCRHCRTGVNPSRSATLFPSKLTGVYQTSQHIAKNHLLEACTEIPQEIRTELLQLCALKESSQGGKEMWARSAQALGVYEDSFGLRFTELGERYYDPKQKMVE